MWLFLSLASALSESVKDTFSKWGSTKTDEYTAAIALHLFTVLVTIPLVLWHGIPHLTPLFWWGTLGFLPVTPLWSISYMKAVKLSPLSHVLPMMAFNPIMTALLSFVFQGKGIAVLGWVGILFISAGIYGVNLKPDQLKKGWITPLVEAFSDRGSQYMLFVAFLWSIGAYLSKWRVSGSDPIFSTMTSGLIGIVTTSLLARVLKKSIDIKCYLKNGFTLLPIGVSYYLANITSSYALTTGQAAYVFSIKRGSIITSALTGKYIFKEALPPIKIGGIILIAIGIFFLSI